MAEEFDLDFEHRFLVEMREISPLLAQNGK
jgi:hypothetical protein